MHNINIFVMGYSQTHREDLWSLCGKLIDRMGADIPPRGIGLRAALNDMLLEWGDTDWTIDSLIEHLVREPQPTANGGMASSRIGVFNPVMYEAAGAKDTALIVQAGTRGHFDALRIPANSRRETVIAQISRITRTIIEQTAVLGTSGRLPAT